MKTIRLKGLDLYIQELNDVLCAERYADNHYQIDLMGEYILEVALDSKILHSVDYHDGFPVYHSEVVSIEVYNIAVYGEDEEYLLDPKQIEILCKDIGANNVIPK